MAAQTVLGEPLLGVDGPPAAAAAAADEAAGEQQPQPGVRPLGPHGALLFCADAAASACLGYFLFCVPLTDEQYYGLLGALAAAMLLWRAYRSRSMAEDCGVRVPYTCGFVSSGGRELFLVATVHISPRAPADVKAVIECTKPDIAMIELDDERLDRMRGVEQQRLRSPEEADLQPIRLTEMECEPVTLFTQRAVWNGEREGAVVSGDLLYDEANAYGMAAMGEAARGRIVLVRRGAPEQNQFAPFALKAHHAARGGAEALLVINNSDSLPPVRIGIGDLLGDLRVALATGTCGFPRIPVLLLPRKDGERLRERCALTRPVAHGGQQTERASVHCEFQVLPDGYPRRTLRRRLCQTCALMLSGIGILYGIIGCFAVEVGAEFLAAEIQASAQGIPCTCIDVDMNRFWSRLAALSLPTPWNLRDALLSWLACPRVLFRVLFPPRGNVDVLGSTGLHLASLPIRTWIAFIVAGCGASFVMTTMLQLFSYASEQGAERTGAISAKESADTQALIMVLVELYLFPQIYSAVAASRDEAMYRSIVATCRQRQSKRLVVVVGAGHANGILQRARVHGL